MALPALPFKLRFTSSRQLLPGSLANNIMDMLTSFQGTITALAGGGFAGAPTLNAAFNEITVAATGGDSVALPLAQVGLAITITNSGASSVNVFPQPTDVINAGAAGASIALAAAATADYVCTKTGVWKRYASA